MSRQYLVLMIALLCCSSFLVAGDKVDFELADLEGDWEGVGSFVVPMTGMEMEIEGKANFKYLRDEKYLRTSLTGEKFLFTYSDSGHMVLHEQTDSLTWEVWDNLGRHSLYRGAKQGNQLLGQRMRKGKLYSAEINLITMDSISFRLSTTDDGQRVDKAKVELWRVK
ncbi:MAG: hypothetical protein P1R58_12495 [bacterium]|nr:hypothetical protein [bacterium]